MAMRSALEGRPLAVPIAARCRPRVAHPARDHARRDAAGRLPAHDRLRGAAMSARRTRSLALALALLAGCSAATRSSAACPTTRADRAATQWTVNLPSAPGAVAVDAAWRRGHPRTARRARGRRVRAARSGRRQLEGAGLDWPVIDGDLVLVPANGAAGGRCVALDRVSGRERWTVDTGPGEIAAVAVRRRRRRVREHDGTRRRDRSRGRRTHRVGRSTSRNTRPAGRSRCHRAVRSRSIAAAGVVALVVAVERTWVLTSLDLASGAQGNGVPLGSAGAAVGGGHRRGRHLRRR